MDVQQWIAKDETAKEMLSRALKHRPFFLLPPLHRVPLRVGNVVELVGPSPSAKTQILIQAAVSAILPKEWNGVHYGGLGQLVLFLDLDCRFDVLRLSEVLKHRIIEADGIGSSNRGCWEQQDVDTLSCGAKEKKPDIAYDEELFAFCMRRFSYVRCYDSLEFLSTLKVIEPKEIATKQRKSQLVFEEVIGNSPGTLNYRLQKARDTSGAGVNFLIIDSIGSFHWIDRVSSSLPFHGSNRKNLSLQSVSETVVQEIDKLRLMHPMLVIATKATILGDRFAVNEVKWKSSSLDSSYLKNVTSNTQQLRFRDFMPSAWQSFVTHRVFLQPTDDQSARSEHEVLSMYSLQWLLPPLSYLENFTVTDAGVFMVS